MFDIAKCTFIKQVKQKVYLDRTYSYLPMSKASEDVNQQKSKIDHNYSACDHWSSISLAHYLTNIHGVNGSFHTQRKSNKKSSSQNGL